MATSNESLNTVKAQGQLKPNQYVDFQINGGDIKVVFIGNSITRHGPAPDIGWHGNWGMAASCPENDYVHKTLLGMKERGMKVDSCIAQIAVWETRFTEDQAPLEEFFTEVRDFAADIVIVRVGENMKKTALCPESKVYFDRMIQFFAVNPKAKVIVTDSFWEHPIRSCRRHGYRERKCPQQRHGSGEP